MRALALLLFSSAAAAQTAPDVAGCYRVVVDRDDPWPDSLAHLQDPRALPVRLELADEPYTITRIDREGTEEEILPPGLEHARSVRYPGLPDGAVRPFALWIEADGHVGLTRYMPNGGLSAHVEAGRGGVLAGTVTSSTHVIRDWATSAKRPVRLEPEPCPR